MASILVQKVENNKVDTAPTLKALQDTVEMVRQRAFELFEHRGYIPGNELEDWIHAERDLFWVPQAELAETDSEVEITIAVPGFYPQEVHVTAQPGEIVIRGDHEKRTEKKEKGVLYSEFGEKALYRRFEIAQPIDVCHVTANVENGMLTVKAPKKAPQAIAEQKAASAA
jgi:HSP20 family molecular chaperone IbpA